MRRVDLVDVALGHKPADLVIKGGKLVNVATAEVYPASVAVKGNRIAAVGDVDYAIGEGTKVIDATGRYLTPGFIEAHMHGYHSFIGIPQFAEAMVLKGATTYVDSFYGPGIVAGKEAVRFFKDAFEGMPLRNLFLVPTLAYIQNRDAGLTPSEGVSPADMMEMLEWSDCYGLEEPPPLPLLEKWPEIVELCERALSKRMVIGGHAAALDPRSLQAYTAMGVSNDHEAITTSEAIERARAGYGVLMRMASAASHQPELIRAVTEHGVDPRKFGFCCDESSQHKLENTGSVLANLRQAISSGVPPITAIQMATINSAETYYASHEIGQIAAGRIADILIVDDLTQFNIEKVIAKGEVWVENGKFVKKVPDVVYPPHFLNTVKVAEPVTAKALMSAALGDADEVLVRVIGTDGGFITDERRARLPVKDGLIQPDIENDVLAIAMVDRLQKGTGIGTGFCQGFTLKRGAIASTANAVCENIIVIGADFDDMALAANYLAEIGGGFVAVAGGEVLAAYDMPLLGLMNTDTLDVARVKVEKLQSVVQSLGCPFSDPFVSLELCCAITGLPDIRISEEGLSRHVPAGRLELIVEEDVKASKERGGALTAV